MLALRSLWMLHSIEWLLNGYQSTTEGTKYIMRVLKFSQQCSQNFKYFGILHSVDWKLIPDDSKGTLCVVLRDSQPPLARLLV
jgi:hypothetical protein